MLRKAGFLMGVTVMTLAGCEQREAILPGERIDVREVLTTRAEDSGGPVANSSRAIALPAAVTNADWQQSHVTPSARIAHPALAEAIKPLWSAKIGKGDSRRNRIDADPVIADGRVFAMDADNQVVALSLSGEELWRFDLTPARDKPGQSHGGGLAYGDGKLFVASGFGTLTALDPAKGAELWVQKLGTSATGAPSYGGGLVYVVSGDSVGWAIEATDGRVRWQVEQPADINNVAGGPAPAISDEFVTFAYGSGTVQTVFRQGGLRLWNADILGRRNGVALTGVTDVTGDPVVVGDRIYAANHSGRMVAFSLYDGERIWTAKQGATGPVWAAGDSVFFVSDRNQLVRLGVDTGEQIWAVDLPGYLPRRRPNNKRDAAFVNYGPVLAGGRLLVAGSDGMMRSFAPEDGALVSSVEIAGGATTRPVVAGGTAYVVSRKGVLHAYR